MNWVAGFRWSVAAILVMALLHMCIAWLTHGLDLPFFDDWRSYYWGTIDTLDSAVLFTPVNDTLTPVGFLLDSLAQRWLLGNSIAYQAITIMLVLGGLLWAQWRTVSVALGAGVLSAAVMVVALLMLQPGSYWGRENMAYHQALPALFLALALALMRCRYRAAVRVVLGVVLGLLAGLSYVSGAFAGLAAGLVLLLGGLVLRAKECDAAVTSNWPIALPLGWVIGTAVASSLQMFKAVLPRLRSDMADVGFPLAWPNEPEFWWYALGKVGRSLGLNPASDAAWFVTLGGVALWILSLGVLLFRCFVGKTKASPATIRVTVALLAWTAALAVYLAMISMARAHYRPDALLDARSVFQFGFERFHFFWVTMVWPWVIAGIVVASGAVGRFVIPGLAMLGVVYLVFTQGLLDHQTRFSEELRFRLETVACLHAGLQHGGPVICTEAARPDYQDIRLAYLYARDINASFVRRYPIHPHNGVGFQGAMWQQGVGQLSEPALSLLAGASSNWTWGVAVQTERDANWEVAELSDPVSRDCRLMDVILELSAGRADQAQLFFRPRHVPSYSEQHSAVMKVQTGRQVIRWRVESPVGFEPNIRVDPVASPQSITLHSMQIQCRLPTREALLRKAGR